MNRDNQFDELLDYALSEYREAEPLSGLEDRVLQRLQSQPVERRHAWWIWGAIATCAALVLIGIWIGVKDSTPPKEGGVAHQASSASPAPAAVEPSAPPTKDSPVATSRRPEPRTSARPKSSEVESAARTRNPVQAFPTPVRMTNEEHALVTVATAHPDVLQASVRENEPITIAPVDIKPLASPTEHEGDN
jgi:hypothetical protein